jgi:hypothetical protein
VAKIFFILIVTGALSELLPASDPPLAIDSSHPDTAR